MIYVHVVLLRSFQMVILQVAANICLVISII